MNKIISRKIVLSLFFVALVLLVSYYLLPSKNKETITDLGNGWKSYSHEDIGFTVKVPEDAEIEAGIAGNKNEQFVADFSKGDIEYVRAVHNTKRDNFDDPVEINRYFSNNGCKGWKYKSGVDEYKSWCEKIAINGKTIIILFSEAYRGEDEIMLKVYGIRMLGKTKMHYISLKKEAITHTGKRIKGHQNFTQEEVNDFVEKKTRLIKDLVLSINKF